MPFPTEEVLYGLGWSPRPSAPPVFSGCNRWLMIQPESEMLQIWPSDRDDAYWLATIINRSIGRLKGQKLVGRMSPLSSMGLWDAIRYLYGDGSSSHVWYDKPESNVWCSNPWTKPRANQEFMFNSNYDDGGGVPSWMQFLTATPYAEPIPLVGFAKKAAAHVYNETLNAVPARRSIRVEE